MLWCRELRGRDAAGASTGERLKNEKAGDRGAGTQHPALHQHREAVSVVKGRKVFTITL